MNTASLLWRTPGADELRGCGRQRHHPSGGESVRTRRREKLGEIRRGSRGNFPILSRDPYF